MTLMISGATATSLAFMLSVGAPPNAIVFGSGYITIPQIAKIGLALSIHLYSIGGIDIDVLAASCVGD